MAWTHCIKSRTDTLDLGDDETSNVTVVVDRSIYVFGYKKPEGELQVQIFDVDSSTWDIVRFPEDTGDFVPWEMASFFAVTHGNDIWLFSEDFGMEISLFVLDTNTLQWEQVDTYGPAGWDEHSWGGCVLHGELYILRPGNFEFELWALNLTTMRWKFVSEIDLDDSYSPVCFVAYETRIYIHLQDTDHLPMKILVTVYYDTVSKRWEWLNLPEDTMLPRTWTSFLYSKHFYYLSGMPGQQEFVFRYSLERNETDRIRLEGIPPLDFGTLGNVVVLDNKVFFLVFEHAAVYVLDMEPSLKTRCLAAVSKYELDTSCIPATLQTELTKYTRSAEELSKKNRLRASESPPATDHGVVVPL